MSGLAAILQDVMWGWFQVLEGFVVMDWVEVAGTVIKHGLFGLKVSSLIFCSFALLRRVWVDLVIEPFLWAREAKRTGSLVFYDRDDWSGRYRR